MIGAGPIAATIINYLFASGWKITEFLVCDLVHSRAEALAADLSRRGSQVAVAATPQETIRGAEVVVFATTAGKPYLNDPRLFSSEQTVLHVSLRDLGVPVVLEAQNVVDDVDHALKAQTSLHLAELELGHRGFVAGTISHLISGVLKPDLTRPRIFSPFGLGVLDLALSRFLYDCATSSGDIICIEDFFG